MSGVLSALPTSVPLAFGWRHLLFANWPVDADVIDTHLPDALSVDRHDGTGWLSIIPLLNVRTRPRGLPGWTGVAIPELNLRTYVTRDGEPGVYFFSLDAQGVVGALTVLGARLTHHLPYYLARGHLRLTGDRVAFESRRRHPGARPTRYEATYGPNGDPFTADPGSRAEFLTERRRLYTQAAGGSLRHTDVTHDRWTLYPATASVAENTLFEANAFDHPDASPELYYSPGVDVVTTRSRRWDREG